MQAQEALVQSEATRIGKQRSTVMGLRDLLKVSALPCQIQSQHRTREYEHRTRCKSRALKPINVPSISSVFRAVLCC